MRRDNIKHWIYLREKHDNDIQAVSRKTKKAIIGERMSKKKLKARIEAVRVTIKKYPLEADLSDRFCPKCGCNQTRSSGNMAEYPELWVRHRCLRCGYLVAETDNSPGVHVLELMCGPEKEDWDPKYWG